MGPCRSGVPQDAVALGGTDGSVEGYRGETRIFLSRYDLQTSRLWPNAEVVDAAILSPAS
jgi:hypothetical protein